MSCEFGSAKSARVSRARRLLLAVVALVAGWAACVWLPHRPSAVPSPDVPDNFAWYDEWGRVYLATAQGRQVDVRFFPDENGTQDTWGAMRLALDPARLLCHSPGRQAIGVKTLASTRWFPAPAELGKPDCIEDIAV
ncbi:MAG: hypothetical protein HYU66_23105, partial [Armatimonadetes bacterium]|nr:hypothetical protein [Armatimonadota bacterium]